MCGFKKKKKKKKKKRQKKNQKKKANNEKKADKQRQQRRQIKRYGSLNALESICTSKETLKKRLVNKQIDLNRAEEKEKLKKKKKNIDYIVIDMHRWINQKTLFLLDIVSLY